MRKRGLSVSGAAPIGFVNVSSFQPTKPSGGFFFFSLRSFFGSPAAFMAALAFSISCSGLGDRPRPRCRSPNARARPGDLMEFASAQPAHLEAVEFRKRGQDHGMDGHVDAHAQRCRCRRSRQKPLLGEFFHREAIARQHARVMHAHAASQQALQRFAERPW